MHVKKILIGALAVMAAWSCGHDSQPTDQAPVNRPSFSASVDMTPNEPVRGRWLSFNLEVQNETPIESHVTIFLRIVSQTGRVIYSHDWQDLHFPGWETWKISQGFLTDTNTPIEPYTIGVNVADTANGELYFAEDGVSSFVMRNSVALAPDGGFQEDGSPQ
jgi:hypothetical protein